MRTETVSIFTFAELSEHAQQKALDNWRSIGSDFGWDEEWRASLKEFAELTGVTIKDYEINPYGYSYLNWTFNEPGFERYYWRYAETNPAETMTGIRLRTWIINHWYPGLEQPKCYWLGRAGNFKKRHSKIQKTIDCPLTGYCGDMDLIQPILDFVKQPNERVTLLDLLSDCLESFRIAWQHDLEYQLSDEYIRETIEANGYEFYADGSMV